MNATTFPEALARITAAANRADLFAADLAGARRTYRELARLVHPDHVTPPDTAAAQAAFAKLTALYGATKSRTTSSPGASPAGPLPVITIKVGPRSYTTTGALAEGDLASLLLARFEEEDDTFTAVIKAVRDPANEDLLAAEAAALRALATLDDPAYGAFFPELLDVVRLPDAAGGPARAANVLRDLPGFVSLAEVMAAYPAGLDARDVAWMWRRLLTALGAAHRAGVVHGAVTPEHVLIEPAEHGLVLVDWCYSVLADAAGAYSPLTAVVPQRRELYPPEILAHGPASPASDIFMATKVMEALLDAGAPHAIRTLADGCTTDRAIDRPDDAWAVLSELDATLVRLFGPHQFRPFSLPARGPAVP